MKSDANDRDTVKGPKLTDPIEPDDKPRSIFAPKKPEQPPVRQKSDKDRAPGNKRQASYSKKLATMKASIGSGKAIKPGEVVGYDTIKAIVGGNRDTGTALRNDLAKAGFAHWQGRRLIAGRAT